MKIDKFGTIEVHFHLNETLVFVACKKDVNGEKRDTSYRLVELFENGGSIELSRESIKDIVNFFMDENNFL